MKRSPWRDHRMLGDIGQLANLRRMESMPSLHNDDAYILRDLAWCDLGSLKGTYSEIIAKLIQVYTLRAVTERLTE